MPERLTRLPFVASMLTSIDGRYQSRVRHRPGGPKRGKSMSAKLLGPMLAALSCLAFTPVAEATLDNVKSRGVVVCGATAGTPGFSAANVNSEWTGLGSGFCRCLAAVIFNDPEK